MIQQRSTCTSFGHEKRTCDKNNGSTIVYIYLNTLLQIWCPKSQTNDVIMMLSQEYSNTAASAK